VFDTKKPVLMVRFFFKFFCIVFQKNFEKLKGLYSVCDGEIHGPGTTSKDDSNSAIGPVGRYDRLLHKYSDHQINFQVTVVGN
jgi:hypothetical protein